VNVEAAPRTVEDEVLELALEVGLLVQQLEPEYLGRSPYPLALDLTEGP
jgi:hypothetical protein